MFKICEKPEFTHKVTVLVPVDGGHKEEAFSARFQVLPSDKTESFNLQNTDELKGFLREALVGMEDLANADGMPLAYNDEVREAVLDLPYARLGLLRTYMTAISKARMGN